MEIHEIFSLGDLFEEVQLTKVFPDGKTFVDCVPKKDLAFIRERYEEQKNDTGFNLSSFVHEYFIEPESIASGYTSDPNRTIEEHIELLWDVLTRLPEKKNDSLISLPYAYIVPGGRFREIYYWDSYFTMLGLQVSGKIDMIQNMVDNFSYLVDKVGHIPNGNRTYYISRSQPPFYASMVKLLSEEKGKDILIKYLPQLEKEYNFWMKGSDQINSSNLSAHRVVLLQDGNVLNHYWDEKDTPRPESYSEEIELSHSSDDKPAMYRHLRAACESGWDFSSRWFKDGKNFSTIHTADIIPVDLNCLLYNLEQTIAEAYQLEGNDKTAERFITLSVKRSDALNKYCWSEEKEFYFDYDYVASRQKDSFTLAAVFPLYFKMASHEQATSVAKNLKELFLKDGGLITTTEVTNQQWDSPNGWAPLQWIAVVGLKNYGYDELAKDIAERWMAINKKVYRDTGKMMEKYNVVDTNLAAGGGEYTSQDGFGWSNGVYLALGKMMNH